MEQAAQNLPGGLGLIRTPSLAEQTCDAIVDGIASGALRPGQRLVETELAHLLQVSRVPLREALKVLEAQGIVESSRHRGTRITDFDERRFDQICEARVALERIAIVEAARACREQPELLMRFEALIETMERAARQPDWSAISKADLAFHREMCRVGDNPIVLTLWEAIARHVLIVFGNETRHERDAAAIGPNHRKLLTLLRSAGRRDLETGIERHIMRLRRKAGDGKHNLPTPAART